MTKLPSDAFENLKKALENNDREYFDQFKAKLKPPRYLYGRRAWCCERANGTLHCFDTETEAENYYTQETAQ